jgi:hypothetical protein
MPCALRIHCAHIALDPVNHDRISYSRSIDSPINTLPGKRQRHDCDIRAHSVDRFRQAPALGRGRARLPRLLRNAARPRPCCSAFGITCVLPRRSRKWSGSSARNRAKRGRTSVVTTFLRTQDINSVETISRPPLPPRPRRCLMVRKRFTRNAKRKELGARPSIGGSLQQCTLAPKAREAVTTTSRSHTAAESGRKWIFLYAITTSRGSD